MKLIKQTIVACAIAFTTSNAASAGVFDIAADGTLLGATGVDVGGTLYVVSFRDGVSDNSITAFDTFAG